MNMQLRQCFARAKPIRLKTRQKMSEFFGFFSKKAKGVKKARISKSGLKSQIDNPILRPEIPSGMCAKLRTVAASNNGVHMP